MEEDIAILMADLSGYTALTETHGPHGAADMVEKYISIVQDCLVGDSHLHGVVGDEVIVISSSPDHLIYTTLLLIQKTCKEEKFLQVHGGLHFGKILKRNNNYFGTTINLASRITNKAAPGTFWCSHEYVRALSDPSAFTFESKGKHSFKNISEEKEVFELITDHPKAFIIDPVCRMIISNEENAVQHPEMAGLLFCSTHCMDIYMRNKGKQDVN
ncbi:MAG: adenylate/guanylate cyclase domain-containing protein [Chitinophagaceae bacterium]|nr:MAG: adenylate/guanylate cyclase domain-containing protein [Chitinophagaceae bacterium]